MLGQPRIEVNVPISDLEQAIVFYGGKLGLELFERRDDWGYARFRSGETRLNVMRSGTAGQARHTLASFVVGDVRATVDDLKGRGVTFEEYDSGPYKTEHGVATMGDTRSAWMKDPDGNILEVVGASRRVRRARHVRGAAHRRGETPAADKVVMACAKRKPDS
jgi:catechol 2,3-dioxygenase-like lactoylglutathione lyase family enzyme